MKRARVLISLRQITKAVDISVAAAAPGSVIPFKLVIKGSVSSFCELRVFADSRLNTDKHVLSEDEKKTQEYVLLIRVTLGILFMCSEFPDTTSLHSAMLLGLLFHV